MRKLLNLLFKTNIPNSDEFELKKKAPVDRSVPRRQKKNSIKNKLQNTHNNKKRSNPNLKAHSTNNYNIQYDDTAIDNFVKEVSYFFDDEIIGISVGGMSTIPPRTRNQTKEHLVLNIKNKNNQYWVKRYYTKFLFQGSNNKIKSIIDSLPKIDNPKNFYEDVLMPISSKINSYFKDNFPSYAEHSSCSIGFPGKNISLTIRLELPITVHDIINHCGRQYITEYADSLKDEFRSVCENRLKNNTDLCFHIYGDYDYRKQFFRECENKLRKIHNIPEIGKGHISQYLLYTHLKDYYKDLEYECSPEWLGRQRYDMYDPVKKVAVEYNGKQHYEPVDLFGGEEALAKNIKRDEEKLKKSIKNGVKLYVWHYSIPINEKTIKEFISKVE